MTSKSRGKVAGYADMQRRCRSWRCLALVHVFVVCLALAYQLTHGRYSLFVPVRSIPAVVIYHPTDPFYNGVTGLYSHVRGAYSNSYVRKVNEVRGAPALHLIRLMNTEPWSIITATVDEVMALFNAHRSAGLLAEQFEVDALASSVGQQHNKPVSTTDVAIVWRDGQRDDTGLRSALTSSAVAVAALETMAKHWQAMVAEHDELEIVELRNVSRSPNGLLNSAATSYGIAPYIFGVYVRDPVLSPTNGASVFRRRPMDDDTGKLLSQWPEQTLPFERLLLFRVSLTRPRVPGLWYIAEERFVTQHWSARMKSYAKSARSVPLPLSSATEWLVGTSKSFEGDAAWSLVATARSRSWLEQKSADDAAWWEEMGGALL